MSLKYHRVLPTANNLNGFQENDQIDFLISADPQRALKSGSVVLEYQLEIFKTGSTLTTNARVDEICMKNSACFIDQVRVEVENKGTVENMLYYNRYCSLVNSAEKTPNQHFNTLDSCQGIVPLRCQEFINCQQLSTQTGGASAKRDPHYMHEFKIGVNRSVGGEYRFSDMGNLKVSITLAKALKALYGRQSATADVGYRLKNVAVRYQTRLQDPSNKLPVMYYSYKAIKADIASTNNMIQAVVPSSSCSGVVMNFIRQSQENLFRFNSNAGQVLRNVESVRFLYNSNLGERIAYDVDDLDEMLKQGVDALNENGMNNISRRELASDENFLLGVNFKSLVNLNNVNTQVNIQLSAPSETFNAYLYFLEVNQL